MLSLSLNLLAVNSPTVKGGTPSLLLFHLSLIVDGFILLQKQCRYLKWSAINCDYNGCVLPKRWYFISSSLLQHSLNLRSCKSGYYKSDQTTAEESIGLREEWPLLSEQAVSRCSSTHRHTLHTALKSQKFLFPEIAVHAKIHGCRK